MFVTLHFLFCVHGQNGCLPFPFSALLRYRGFLLGLRRRLSRRHNPRVKIQALWRGKACLRTARYGVQLVRTK